MPTGEICTYRAANSKRNSGIFFYGHQPIIRTGASDKPGAVHHPQMLRLIEPLGDATLVHFDAHSGRSLVAKVAPSMSLSPGSALKFTFDPARCHLFDAATQARIN